MCTYPAPMTSDPARAGLHGSTAAAAGPAAVLDRPCTCQAVRQAARRVTAMYDAAMAPFGLRISQFSLLARLRRSGPVSVQALAADMGLDRTTLGRNLRPLERDGLVRSEADSGDGRIRRLAVTETGLERLRLALPAWTGVQAAFEAGYGAAETEALHAALCRAGQAAREAAGDGPPASAAG